MKKALTEYLNGNLTLPEISRKHKIPETTFRSFLLKSGSSKSVSVKRSVSDYSSGEAKHRKESALRSVADGMSIGKASRDFGIPRTTLKNFVQSMDTGRKKKINFFVNDLLKNSIFFKLTMVRSNAVSRRSLLLLRRSLLLLRGSLQLVKISSNRLVRLDSFI